MKESSTYQAILAEGRAEGLELGIALGKVAEAKKVLRLQGVGAFGRPSAAIAAAIERMTDLAHLEALLRRVRTAESWQDLFGPAASAPRNRRRSSETME